MKAANHKFVYGVLEKQQFCLVPTLES